MLTDHDKVLEVNSRGEPASGSVNEEHSGEPSKELPKISLQEVCFSKSFSQLPVIAKSVVGGEGRGGERREREGRGKEGKGGEGN